jgi:EAL domain-containing protein (putative c-di-GMP-specific phosphodiesterase class I)
MALESELRKALSSDQFRLHYQLQVDYQNRPIGAEVLIRWIHPEKGIISPMEFIPLAEEIGLIIPIGRWVLEIACAQLKAWQHKQATQGLGLSVNVSAKQFHQPDFIDVICGLVKKYEIAPMLLKLELTESMLIENIEDTIQTITRLKSIGIGFSLDDFGTGYSSLQYLKRLPLDQLKIDQSFVRDLLLDQNDTAIVLTIIALGQSMGLEVIAEGVETEEQRDFLAMHGCYRYQGYFFSKPLPLEEFERFVDLYSGHDLTSRNGKIRFGG